MNEKEVELSTVIMTVIFLSVAFLWCCMYGKRERNMGDSDV